MARLFLRVYFSSSTWLGPGKIQLLESVRDRGSISAGARAMRMSYRRAWLIIDVLNRLFKQPVVRTAPGGRGGGTAVVTPFGLDVIRRYRAMEAAARRAIARDAGALTRHLRRSPRRRAT